MMNANILETFLLGSIFVILLACALNVRLAKRSRLPLVFSPVDAVNPLWILTQPLLLPLLRRLPWFLGSWTRYNQRGWLFRDKYKMHTELGDAWMHVTPLNKTVYIADAAACQQVYTRKDDFVKPTHMFRVLELFGKNLMTVDGHAWQLHRRVTAPSFNDRRSAVVWKESIRQAQEAVSAWSYQGTRGTSRTHENSMTLAFHVLANTGFGTDYSFKDIDDIPSKMSYTMTWSKASNTVRENMLVAVAIPNCILSMPFAPQKWNQAGRAIAELKRYMADILDQERSHFFKGMPKSGKLLSSLMHASDEVKRGKEGQLERPKAATSGLSREEMLGDIYVFSLAGHETTGNALAFAIYLLSVHPEIQTWVQEEIDQVHRDNDTISELEYESSPLLKRSLAVMLETLRLFPSVIAVPKYTQREQKLSVGDQVHTIPPKTMVILNVTAIHTHPKYWGEDSLVWRPSRWIEAKATNSAGHVKSSGSVEDEVVRWPQPGTFFPWSDGLRVCPGKRYSQVEFVAVLSTLLRRHRVEPVRMAGESKEGARHRVLDRLADCKFTMTLHMRDPSSVAMQWISREP